MEYIFAYGSLQRPETQKEATGREFGRPTPAFVKGEVFNVGVNGQPYRILHPDNFGRLVPGLVFEIDGRDLPRLDAYETSMYVRRKLDLFDTDGRPHAIPQAWAYAATPQQITETRRHRLLRQSDLF